jgi:hypothetical protein
MSFTAKTHSKMTKIKLLNQIIKTHKTINFKNIKNLTLFNSNNSVYKQKTTKLFINSHRIIQIKFLLTIKKCKLKPIKNNSQFKSPNNKEHKNSKLHRNLDLILKMKLSSRKLKIMLLNNLLPLQIKQKYLSLQTVILYFLQTIRKINFKRIAKNIQIKLRSLIIRI